MKRIGMAVSDPNMLSILEDIRQEVEDMAYERLRLVLSDFSLQDVELANKIEQHKYYIKVR